MLTLRPGPASQASMEGFCLLCGTRGLADAVLNLLMFVPLGALARLRLRSARAAILLTLMLAAGIEGIQLLVPARDSSLGDILFNAAGGATGAILPPFATRAWRATGAASARLSLLAAILVVSVHTLTAWALGPHLPRGRYFSFWAPELGHLASTGARLTAVTLDGRPLPEGWIEQPDTVRRLLIDGRPLVVRSEPGVATRSVGGLYALYDDRQNEILLVGRIGDDLVLRVHRRATRLRLDVPDIRVGGFFARGDPGSLLTIRLESDPAHAGAYCATRLDDAGVGGSGGRPESGVDRAPRVCDLGFTLGLGWALLGYPDALPAPLRGLSGIAWIGLFFVPIGLWARPRWETGFGLLLAAGCLLVVPLVSTLLPTPPHLHAAAAIGLCAGLSCSRLRARGWGSGGARWLRAGR